MITVETVGRDFHARFAYDPAVVATVQQIPGREWDKARKMWTFPATSCTAAALRAAGATGDAAFNRLLWRHDIGAEVLAGRRLDEYEATTPPFPHQKLGTNLIAARDGVMLIWEMGTGKTKATIDAIVSLNMKAVLVIAPLSVVPVWATQFRRHAAGRSGIEVIELVGSVEAKRRRAETALKFDGCHVFVLNYESVWREPFAEFALSRVWDMVVADESQRAKAADGRAGKFLMKLGRRAIKRVALTGTPMPHGPLDIFTQMAFVDAGVFGLSYGRFKNRYTVKGGFMGREVVGYANQGEMQERIYRAAHRVTKDEVLDLPEFQHVAYPVQMSDKARDVYEQVDARIIAGVIDGTITVTNALTELLRLQQITGGWATLDEVTDETGQTVREARSERVDTAKEDALVDLFTDIPKDEKIVVFARFVNDLRTIREAAAKCGRESRELSGGANELEQWQTNTDPDGRANKATVLAVQIRTGGLGVDMSMAAYAVYYSVGFSLGDYEQSLARVHRQGQTRRVTYYHLVARDTVDEKVYAALQEKKAVIEAVLDEMKDAE